MHHTCSGDDGGGWGEIDGEGAGGAPGDCIVVDMAVSPEKIDLLTDLARTSTSRRAEVDGQVHLRRAPRASRRAAAMQLLADGWDEATEGHRPVIWSPAAARGARSSTSASPTGRRPMAGEGTPFMLTPLVIAMPKPMAEALG